MHSFYFNFPKDHIGNLPDPGEDSHRWTKGDSAEETEAAIKLFVDTVVKGISDEDMANLPAHQREQLDLKYSPLKIPFWRITKRLKKDVMQGNKSAL